jgi:hypothetical protein
MEYYIEEDPSKIGKSKKLRGAAKIDCN